MWVALMFGIFVTNLFGMQVSAEVSIYLWGAGGVVSAAILVFHSRVVPRHSGVLDWWRIYWPARLRFGSVQSVGQIGVVFVTLAAVTTAGDAAAAGIRGAFTLFGPISTLLSAMPVVFVPHAVRTGNSVGDQWRLLSRTSLATSVLTLVATGILTAVPAGLGAAMLGASWQGTFTVMPYIGITCAAMCWLVGVLTFFQSQGASRTVFGLNALHIALQVVACFVAGWVFGSSIAIAIALALCSFVMAVVGVLRVHRWIHAAAEPSDTRGKPAVNGAGGVVIR
jgi:hypothetical protein